MKKENGIIPACLAWGASFGLGPEGVYYNFSNGYGLIYSLNMEKDMNNEESN